MLLPDLLAPDLRVVFCGTALGTESHRRRAYYAGPQNKFWPTLHEVGLTPSRLRPEQYPRLLELGIGLTDLCKTRSGSDRQIGTTGFEPPRLVDLLERHRPNWIAFTSKQAAKHALALRAVDYGPREQPLGPSNVFVLPSPSGAASGHWNIAPWEELADLLDPPPNREVDVRRDPRT